MPMVDPRLELQRCYIPRFLSTRRLICIIYSKSVKKRLKVKESRNRPPVAHEGGDVVSLTHRPPLPPGNVPGTRFHWGLSRLQVHGTVGRNMSLKNPVTPPGIDPGTVRIVAQRLNHYATPGSKTVNQCKRKLNKNGSGRSHP